MGQPDGCGREQDDRPDQKDRQLSVRDRPDGEGGDGTHHCQESVKTKKELIIIYDICKETECLDEMCLSIIVRMEK